MIYKNGFVPYEYGGTGCSDKYIEVGRECYRHSELKRSKADILVYSAILAGMNNPHAYTFSYSSEEIGQRLSRDEREVRRSINNLENMGLISVHRTSNKRSIQVVQDLRYPDGDKGKKSIIKVYDRLFFYPNITLPMIHVYSYYLSLSQMSRYRDGCDVSYKTVAEALGYESTKAIERCLADMERIGLIQIDKRANSKTVKLLVDFSQKQPEEIAYEKEVEDRMKRQEGIDGLVPKEMLEQNFKEPTNRPSDFNNEGLKYIPIPVREGSKYAALDLDWGDL